VEIIEPWDARGETRRQKRRRAWSTEPFFFNDD
jgi:hypothetical protein